MTQRCPNGLLLRANLHRLFDKGYITVTPDPQLQVSDRLEADYNNGCAYYPLQGQPVRLSSNEWDRPAPEFLTWHSESVYLG